MNTRETVSGARKITYGAAAFISVILSGCEQQVREPAPPTIASQPEDTSRLRVRQGTAAELERRYVMAAEAEEAYVRCMERYFPNYRREMEAYGSVLSIDPLDGTPHPSEEGCHAERDRRNKTASEIGFPPI